MAAPPAPPLLLASTSPRRRQILELLRIPFDVVAPDFEETEDDPVAHALGKARSVGVFDERPVLGCDTEVVCGGRVYGKAETDAEAEEMLESLKIVSQAIENLPSGPVSVDVDSKVVAPG